MYTCITMAFSNLMSLDWPINRQQSTHLLVCSGLPSLSLSLFLLLSCGVVHRHNYNCGGSKKNQQREMRAEPIGSIICEVILWKIYDIKLIKKRVISVHFFLLNFFYAFQFEVATYSIDRSNFIFRQYFCASSILHFFVLCYECVECLLQL